nr:hypothetical protein CFP56_11615 [Quercus suber]
MAKSSGYEAGLSDFSLDEVNRNVLEPSEDVLRQDMEKPCRLNRGNHHHSGSCSLKLRIPESIHVFSSHRLLALFACDEVGLCTPLLAPSPEPFANGRSPEARSLLTCLRHECNDSSTAFFEPGRGADQSHRQRNRHTSFEPGNIRRRRSFRGREAHEESREALAKCAETYLLIILGGPKCAWAKWTRVVHRIDGTCLQRFLRLQPGASMLLRARCVVPADKDSFCGDLGFNRAIAARPLTRWAA